MALLNHSQTLSPPQARSRLLAGGMFLLTLSLLAGMISLLLAGCFYHSPNIPFSPAIILGPLTWGLLGLLIVLYRPDTTIGWLCLLAGVTAPVFDLTGMYATCGSQEILSLPRVAYAIWINFSLPILGGGVMAILVPQLYPNGRFLSVRWRRLVIGLLMIHFTATLAVGLLPDFNQDNGFGVYRFPVENPFGLTNLPAWWQPVFSQTSFLTTMALVIIGIISIIVRFRHSTGDERQQIKWLAYFLGTAVTIQIVFFELLGTLFYPQIFETLLYQVVVHITYLGFPLTIGIAIFKYRLYDIDRIINRTLVYGGLTLLITAAYVLLVGGLGTLAANQSGQIIGLVLATAIVIVGIRPLHRMLQMTVNRFVAVSSVPPIDERMTQTSPPTPPTGGANKIPPSGGLGGLKPNTPSRPRSRWLAIALFLLALAAQAGNGGLILAGCTRFADADLSGTIIVTIISSGFAFSILGTLIVFYQPHNRIGWLCLWAGLGQSITLPIHLYITCGLAGHLTTPGLAYVAWLEYSFGFAFSVLPLFILLPVLYPTGHFLSSRWCNVTIGGLIVLAIASLAMAILPDFSQYFGGTAYPLKNPFGLSQLPTWWYSLFSSMVLLVLIFLSFTSVAAMIARLRRSTGDERQQMKWLAYFLATGFSIQLLIFELPGNFFYPQIFETIWYGLIIFAVFMGFPLVIGLAIFKYRLYDIDRIINRTLVYGGLTQLITAVYIPLVSGVGTLAANQSGQVIGLVLATAIVVAVIRPLHRMLQTNVNRFVAVPVSPSVPNSNLASMLPPNPLKGGAKTKIPPSGGLGGAEPNTSPRSRWLASGLFLLSLSLLAGLVWLLLAGCPYSLDNIPFSPAIILNPLAYALLGLLIVFYRPNNLIGWLCLLTGVTGSIFPFMQMYATCGILEILPLPGVAYVAWINFTFLILLGIDAILLPQLYPNGRFLSGRWRRLVVGLLIIHFIASFAVGLLPDFNQDNGFGVNLLPIENPFGIAQLPAWWQPVFSQTLFLSMIALAIIGIISMIVRFRRSVGDERQQIKWLAYFLGTAFAFQIVFFELPGTLLYPQIFETIWYQLIILVTFLGFPLTIGLAIFKYRLYDIDRIINRTLVYGGLTLLITAAYVLLVGGLGTLAANQSGQVIGLVLATVIVVVGIRPLHRALQMNVNRFVTVSSVPPVGKQLTESTSTLPPPGLPLQGGGARKTSPPAGGIEGGRNLHQPNYPSPNTNLNIATKRHPRSLWLTIGVFLLALAAPLAVGWLVIADCTRYSDYGTTGLFSSVASGLIFSVIGGLIFFHRSHNRIGWLCLWTGIGLSTVATIDVYVSCGLAGHLAAPGLAYLAWFVYSFASIFLIIVPMFILLPMLYPNGQFLSPRWQWVSLVGFIVLGLAGLAMGLLPDFNRPNAIDNFFPVINPFGLTYLPGWWHSFFYNTSSLTIFFLCFAGITSMLLRLRRSHGDERQQMKWLAYFLATAVVVQLLGFEIPGAYFYPQIFDTIWYELIIVVVFLGFPLIIGLAIFKYRLYAIDVVINRTLVYGGLTLVVVLIYTLTVGGLGLLFHTTGSLTISLIATALIAIAFQPARERLQRGVNRFMFGQRDDPYAVLSHLSQQLQTTAVPTETLTSIVETIAGTLKLPYAAIELLEQAEQIGQATVGEPVAEVVELPLRYQKETVGRLMVSPRAPGETFTVKEQKLLADIAAQTGPVASATRLTLALQRSRERLVLAREEERRRIRRDLHDGLGPTLASQTLKLDAVLDLLTTDPHTAGQHVTQLKQQTQQMVADIRRLVYELRPPALDELGLLEALRSHVAQMSGLNGQLHLAIEAAPEPLPPLPAAIEVAAYRIALEAVTNVIRHAQAKTCRVRFAITEGQPLPSLVITVIDDGWGLPARFRSGVGLTSMRERAEELGGSCLVGVGQIQGTQVRAMLPFSANGVDK